MVVFGDGDERRAVVIDPIDGSLNAKRLIPTCALSIAVASGDTMEDVEFGYVYDFGSERGVRRAAAARARRSTACRSTPSDVGRGLEVVGLEAARPEWIAPVAAQLEGEVYRIRVVGSIAISLCYVAASRFDGMATTNICRSVDAAAAQLIAREAGAFVSVLGHGGIEAPLDLDARFRLAAARTPEGLETLVAGAHGGGHPGGLRAPSPASSARHLGGVAHAVVLVAVVHQDLELLGLAGQLARRLHPLAQLLLAVEVAEALGRRSAPASPRSRRCGRGSG